MAVKIKKGIMKTIGFDTTKDIHSISDIKVRIINSVTGALVPGCETVLTELPVDPNELTFKQGDVIATSGANKLNNTNKNCLLFEVYQKGQLVNPEKMFETKALEQ